jgi:hypothetical protein
MGTEAPKELAILPIENKKDNPNEGLLIDEFCEESTQPLPFDPGMNLTQLLPEFHLGVAISAVCRSVASVLMMAASQFLFPLTISLRHMLFIRLYSIMN